MNANSPDVIESGLCSHAPRVCSERFFVLLAPIDPIGTQNNQPLVGHCRIWIGMFGLRLRHDPAADIGLQNAECLLVPLQRHRKCAQQSFGRVVVHDDPL